MPTPPLAVQRKIASVLAVYDELIENNLRRIAILEEIAQAVYREWFVNFRFPGHEDVPLSSTQPRSDAGGLEGEAIGRNGRVHQPWDLAEVRRDQHFGAVLNQKCIRDHRVSLGPSRTHTTNVKSEKVVRRGDVLVNSTGVGTLGRVAQFRSDMEQVTVDSHVTIIRPPCDMPAEYWLRPRRRGSGVRASWSWSDRADRAQ